jgi:MinD superfamily P-loop ATPase
MQIDQDKCLKCGTCQMNCPLQAIITTDGKYVIDESKCVSCGTCATWCPAQAISSK